MHDDLARLLAAERILTSATLTRTLHMILTLVMFWMAYIFLDSKPSFVPEAHVYDYAKEIMPERCWGFASFSVGMVGLITSYPLGWKIRSFGAAILSFGHAGLAICFALGKSNVPSVGLLLGTAAIGAMLSYSTAYIGKRFTQRLDTSRPMRPLAR